MAKSSPVKLAYQKAYNARPDQKQTGVERRRTARAAVRDGSSPIGDGKDLSHIVAANNGGRMTKSNVKLQDAKTNRDWRKGQKGYTVPTDK
jgi:hypothetical protein